MEAVNKFTHFCKENFIAGMPQENLFIPAMAARWVNETAREFPTPSAEWQQQARAQLEALLSRRNPTSMPGVVYRYDYELSAGGYTAQRQQFEVAPDLLVPAVFVRKTGAQKLKTIILLEKYRGATEEARALLDQGYALLLLDPRGAGEVDWGGSRTMNWALFVGRPPVGMWAEDICKVTTYLLARPDVANVSVRGHGIFGKAALYAAALDTRISAAAVTLDTASYRDEAASGLTHILADVPRILAWGDTPQIAALVAPRPLTILGAGVPVSLNDEKNAYFAPLPRFQLGDARVSPEHLHATFAWTKRFYQALSAESNFTVAPLR